MRLLIDTNIFLEVLLEQDRAEEARQLLTRNQEHEFFISDFSLHSIGLLLFRRRQQDVFRRFLADMLFNAGVGVVALPATEMETVIRASQQFNLDFDDAYQYAVAEYYELTIVSLDADFDRTGRGRRMPGQIDIESR
ncbi:MAG: PIN domain nuclease [Litorilinea sp.]|nr:MAG: PIN domain nuclease [Litorilinea sp.]